MQYATNDYQVQLKGLYICADTISFTTMRLGLPGFFNLAIVYFISARIGALGKNYPQNEIDNAFAKFIKKERFYKKLDEQLGCWPQNVIPFTIKEGFSEYTVLKYMIVETDRTSKIT